MPIECYTIRQNAAVHGNRRPSPVVASQTPKERHLAMKRRGILSEAKGPDPKVAGLAMGPGLRRREVYFTASKRMNALRSNTDGYDALTRRAWI